MDSWVLLESCLTSVKPDLDSCGLPDMANISKELFSWPGCYRLWVRVLFYILSGHCLFEHFTYVADRVEIPMILYNVPSRTGIGLTAETCSRLSVHPNIVGIKEASGDIALGAKIRSLCGDDLYIWSPDHID